MGWSTRELALLAGTTLRAVRHYHEIGLLAEPERRSNGYKAYRTRHLVRLVQIRRLTELGFTLAQIAEVGDAPADDSTIQAVDASLSAAIDRLEHARAELAELREHPAPADMPPRMSAAAADLSPADRSLYAVLAQMAGDASADHWRALIDSSGRDPETTEFDALTEDADEATRERLAGHFAAQARAVEARHPLPPELRPALTSPTAGDALIRVLLDVYNPAQLDVLHRMWKHLGHL
ncbi:MerR family transcriptional regulator [Actinoplanes sp. NPDC049596]|uniref:MerR family transcriptional regulator n=1 Tax=unclassified Actinoplanes TaxID=2626549 RepID=UPI00341621B2